MKKSETINFSFIKVPKCYKCSPVWASNTMASNAKGTYLCECGHEYNM